MGKPSSSSVTLQRIPYRLLATVIIISCDDVLLATTTTYAIKMGL